MASQPFHVLLVGDFSGRDRKPAASKRPLRPVIVDRDNLDEVMASLEVEIPIQLGREGAQEAFRPTELDHFHPDRLFDRLEVFAKLRQLRRRLKNNDTFAAAADEVRSWATPAEKTSAPKPQEPTPAPTGNVLESILGEAPTPSSAPAKTDWARVIGEIVGPYVQHVEPDQEKFLATVDDAVAGQMRTLLHDPAFRELEARWYGLDLLVRRVATDASLKLFLLDVGPEELRADLSGRDDPRDAEVYKPMVESTVEIPGGHPWALIVGLHEFQPSVADALLLSDLGTFAARNEASFVAAGSGAFVGCPSPGNTPDASDWKEELSADAREAWTLLRQGGVAEHLALTWPRYLVRLPYGKKTNPTESFTFEEFVKEPGHEELLWGNGAYLVATLLARGFAEHGWRFSGGIGSEIDGLPYYVRDDEATPIAELYLPERATERVIGAGLLPIHSMRNQDKVLIQRFVSLASSGGLIKGRWS
ncbi:hypothetical protein Pan216_32930 [Planctomycetes bacterium Pan216]|uniref:TssC1 N-terminal domain-containing protein n=1 Tax=Kolteria novifilia TaxID=2527975 RepID=A0A518B632_9BACT|nr:hypothetical protein Pan216_32930 [Planctomycetes bacterium Pan216]